MVLSKKEGPGAEKLRIQKADIQISSRSMGTGCRLCFVVQDKTCTRLDVQQVQNCKTVCLYCLKSLLFLVMFLSSHKSLLYYPSLTMPNDLTHVAGGYSYLRLLSKCAFPY